MRVVIVAKTRRGSGACAGGLTFSGQSVRLIAAGAGATEHAGLEYQVGEVWEIDAVPDPIPEPPHVENILIQSARRLGLMEDLDAFVRQAMPPVNGPPGVLFDGLAQSAPGGALFVAARTGVPSRSTQFWVPDQPLQIDCEGKRIRYRYPMPDGGRTLTFVGFQEPLEVIPAGTVVRVSLAHWWRPKDKPEDELRCYVQLSGWLMAPTGSGTFEPATPVDVCAPALDNSEPGPAPNQAAMDQGTTKATGAPTDVTANLKCARLLLKQRFGFAGFLPTQEQVISRVLEGKDTLAVMPTGGGKSLCYQLPALVFDGLTLVVCPLIALMQDQVHQLRELGIPAGFLNSTLAYREHVAVANRARVGELKILFAAPETLLRPETLLLLGQCRLACIAVDEAHCISEWGHDFRPEYRQLHEMRRRFSGAVCIALTATATLRVRDDIRSRLGIERVGEFVASFNRPNLFLAAEVRHDGRAQTLRFLERQRGEAGIIYCTSRKQVDDLAAELAGRGWPVLPYHAGLEDSVRTRNQDRFVREDGVIMVATIAFGMGINKSNVRFVLHYNVPKDLESYYQEIGRAGRDGLPAQCLLLHSRADAVLARRFIERGAASERPGRQARLEAMLRYAETLSCRREPLLGYFGESPQGNCGRCDRCTQPAAAAAASVDITESAQKFLSCVKRTGETFGAAHIIGVLRGSRSDKVTARRHDQLSTYGIGRNLTVEAWRQLVRQFIEQGLVEQDFRFGSLHLTGDTCEALLHGEKFEKVGESIQYIKAQKRLAGVAAHGLDVVMACEKAGFDVDFYQKTLHSHEYYTAPRADEKSSVGAHDNSWCNDPQAVIDFMAKVNKPWIAFKILAAGAIHPRTAFPYAFKNGADFLLVGMFDWQIEEDAKLAKRVYSIVAGPNSKRTRPWF